MSYVELHARSAFSFLRGASLPEQFAETAAHFEMPAMALCDRDGFYGGARFFAAAKERGVRPIMGAELTMEDGSVLPVLVENKTGYQNLCRLITQSKLRSEKNKSSVFWNELPEFSSGLVALTGDDEGPLHRALLNEAKREAPSGSGFPRSSAAVLEELIRIFGPDSVYVELQRHRIRGEERVIKTMAHMAGHFHLPILATNGVLYSSDLGRQVLDMFTCLRHHTHLDAAGKILAQNSERFLKSSKQMEELFFDYPEAFQNTVRLSERLQFSLENLGYEFPAYPISAGETMDSVLRQQVYAGAKQRYGKLDDRVHQQLEHELQIITKLGFAGYFLIVADIIRYCRENHIMAQGRGSAANSVVCYSLGITAADPLVYNLLFERFLSEGRKGWPDIDIDLPSGDRRERVIQEVYRRYGKHGAAMTANVITYRGRSAAREIGKALNIPKDVLERFSDLFANGDFPHTLDLHGQMERAGFSKQHPRAGAFASLYYGIYGLPRHLGQHSGGMIICQGKLDSIVPLENASMPGRVVAQWDKDDCEDLGIVKVDLLGLGMMSLLQEAFELTQARGGPKDLIEIPNGDPATFEMMQKADTIGVFQIESRAQMATLPRMKPCNFYDVVVEVAIIRPGPIQGHLMHPYLARRTGKEPVSFYDDQLRPVLERTLGVPLFQEQMLKIAMVMAGFSGSEAEELRRALSFHRSQERMKKVERKLRAAMEAKNVRQDVIEHITQAISSFALYGFPESHAISFALLAYASAYLKLHCPLEFYTSLINNQPMGFYSPATIVKDAKRHGVKVRPVCAMHSEWKCTIESNETIRLGFCVMEGLNKEHVLEFLEQRKKLPFHSMDDFKLRTSFNKEELRVLAEIGALNEFAVHRRDALWKVEKQIQQDLFFPIIPAADHDKSEKKDAEEDYGDSPLLPMDYLERLRADYQGMSLTLGPHPMALLRPKLKEIWRAGDLPKANHGQIIQIGGNVICRQRPGTAKGFVFISLEDETGISNAIVSPPLFEKLRLVITQESFLIIQGKVQNRENVIVIQAQHIERLAHDQLVGSDSYDFR